MSVYNKHDWVARIGTGLNKWRDVISNTLFQFVNEPDSVTIEGTPFQAAWMNEMEEGIYQNSLAIFQPNPTTEITQKASIEQVGGTGFKDSIVDSISKQFIDYGKTIVNLPKNSELLTTNSFTTGEGTIILDNGVKATGDGTQSYLIMDQVTDAPVIPNRRYGLICEAENQSLADSFIVEIRTSNNEVIRNVTFDGSLASRQVAITGTASGSASGTLVVRIAAIYPNAASQLNASIRYKDTIGILLVELKDDEQSFTDAQFAEAYDSGQVVPPGINHVDGEVIVTGKNQFDVSAGIYGYGINPGNGQLLELADRYVSGYIEVIPGEDYTISGDAFVNNQNIDIHFYDSDENWIKRKLPYASSLPFTFNIDETNATKIRMSWYEGSPSSPLNVDSVQLEIGTEATKREPHISQSNPTGVLTQWDSKNHLTGETVKNSTPEFIFNGSEGWSSYGSGVGQGGLFSVMLLSNFTQNNDIYAGAGGSSKYAIGFDGKVDYTSFDTQSNVDKNGVLTTGNLILYIRTSDLPSNDASGFTSYLSTNNLRITFKSKDSTIVQTDSEQFQLAKGGTIQRDSAVLGELKYIASQNINDQVNAVTDGLSRLGNEVDQKYTELDTKIDSEVVTLNARIDQVESDADTRLDALENERTVVDDVVIANTGWVAAVGVAPYNWYKDVTVSGVTTDDIVDVNVQFASIITATAAGLAGPTEAQTNAVKILAVNVPSGSITADIIVNKRVVNV